MKRGETTVNSYWSKIWVQQRIVPPDRQNIGEILRDNHLQEYDEYAVQQSGILQQSGAGADNTVFHVVRTSAFALYTHKLFQIALSAAQQTSRPVSRSISTRAHKIWHF